MNALGSRTDQGDNKEQRASIKMEAEWEKKQV